MVPIIKPGFTPGSRGRWTPAKWDRRSHYLASEHGRVAVVLVGAAEQELTVQQAIEALGRDCEYHEIIIAPSRVECDAIRARNPEDPTAEALAFGHRLASAHSQGRPYVLTMHEQDGRFHFHLNVQGPMPAQALGKHGEVQQVWDREFFRGDERIVDWAAHRRFQAERARLQELIRRQQEHERRRREAVRAAAPEKKAEVGRSLERTSRDLIEQRYLLELSALGARYESRGAHGSLHHQAEQDRAEFRRTAALRRVERREHHRQMLAVKGRVTEVMGGAERQTAKAIKATGQVSRTAVDAALREMGVSRPLRATARISVTLASATAQAAVQAAMEAAKAAARSSLHLARGSASLAMGLIAAPFTGGASLRAGVRQAEQDLTIAAKEAGRGLERIGHVSAEGVSQITTSTVRGAVPWELQSLAEAAAGKPGAILSRQLPEEVRRALQVAGILPASPLAVALRLASDLGRSVQSSGRGMERDR